LTHTDTRARDDVGMDDAVMMFFSGLVVVRAKVPVIGENVAHITGDGGHVAQPQARTNIITASSMPTSSRAVSGMRSISRTMSYAKYPDRARHQRREAPASAPVPLYAVAQVIERIGTAPKKTRPRFRARTHRSRSETTSRIRAHKRIARDFFPPRRLEQRRISRRVPAAGMPKPAECIGVNVRRRARDACRARRQNVLNGLIIFV